MGSAIKFTFWRRYYDAFAADQAIEGMMAIGDEVIDHFLPICATVPNDLRKIHQLSWRESFVQYRQAVDIYRGHYRTNAFVCPFIVVGDAVPYVECVAIGALQ